MTLLRDYQVQAVAAFWDALSPDVNRVAIEMATGLGKTLVIGAVADEWLQRNHDQDAAGGALVKGFGFGRVLVLAERDELVRQAVEKIAVVTRGRWTIGVVKAGENEVTADIVVASVATLRQPGRKEQIQNVGLVIVDECHHAVAQTYVDILEYFGGLIPQECPEHGEYCACLPPPPVPVLGVTATLGRGDGAGLGRIFQDMPFSRSLPWGIRHGYLTDLVPYTIKIPDVDENASDATLDTVLADGIAPEAVVRSWAEKAMHMCEECLAAMEQVSGEMDHTVVPGYCPNDWCSLDMPSTVLFAPLVRSAEAFADAFNAAGVKAEVVAGAYSDAHHQAVEARFRDGTTTVVCNAMKWTEGLDVPRISCVIVARPTQNPNLFKQMIGRGLRPWRDAGAPPLEEQRCIVLCVQGTTTELDMVADLSDRIGESTDGKSLLQMEDEWDLGKDIAPEEQLYRGPVRVEAWDALVQQSSKAWKYTKAGAPYLPTAKKRQGYVFVVERDGEWLVFAYDAVIKYQARSGARKVASAPDLELAMALAEDEAQERGGDIGAMLADKGRAWRGGVPTMAAQSEARRLGLETKLAAILASKSSGKAGRLSDLIDRETASRVLDPLVSKIKARTR